ncbi:hypothetical protein DIPPA_05093 [Diplonema papillatum]|nr:hypothetical protein DIPPA_05093 [Diplonema papillatum]
MAKLAAVLLVLSAGATLGVVPPPPPPSVDKVYCTEDAECRTHGDASASCNRDGRCQCTGEYANPSVPLGAIYICIDGATQPEDFDNHYLMTFDFPKADCDSLARGERVDGIKTEDAVMAGLPFGNKAFVATRSFCAFSAGYMFAADVKLTLDTSEEAIEAAPQSLYDYMAANASALADALGLSAPNDVNITVYYSNTHMCNDTRENVKSSVLFDGECNAVFCTSGFYRNDSEKFICASEAQGSDKCCDMDWDEILGICIACLVVFGFMFFVLYHGIAKTHWTTNGIEEKKEPFGTAEGH